MKVNPEKINNVIDEIYSSPTHVILQDDVPLKLNNIVYSDVTYVYPDPDNLNTDCIIIGYRNKKDTIIIIVSKFYENTLPVKNRAIYKEELNHDLTPLISVLNPHNFKRIKRIFDTMYLGYKFNTNLKEYQNG